MNSNCQLILDSEENLVPGESNTLPRMHIQPEHGWLNDPNGMVLLDGEWHVFYQANPEEPEHRNIAWGHVSSTDLIGWKHHPTAFGPVLGQPDGRGCWSGVFLPWLDRPAVAYSAIAGATDHSTVAVREAHDQALDTWGDPYVVAQTPDGVDVMRDPFCFTWNGRQLALLGARIEGDVPAILLFDVADPQNWKYLGVWLRGDQVAIGTPPADIWECPQLLISGDRAILLVSLLHEQSSPSVLSLNGTVSDDAGLPRFTVTSAEPVDEGGVFYAPQLAIDGRNDALLFGWVRDPDSQTSADTGISGCLTLPRRVRIGPGGELESRVDGGLQSYADTFCAHQHQLDQYSSLPLPRCARVRGVAPSLQLEGASGLVEIDCPEGGFELWTDGEVVEVYPAGAPPATLRHSGAPDWVLHTRGAASVTVWELSPPAAP